MLELTPPIANSLIRKWDIAKSNLETTEDAFQQLSANINHTWIVEWTRQEGKAMLERGKAMEVYDVAVSIGARSVGSIAIFPK